MILQSIEALQTIADIIGAIMLFFQPIVTPIGNWMTEWITVATEFLGQNFGENFTFYIIIGVILIVSGVIINIVWPGDKKGSIYSSIEKIEEIEDKGEVSGDKDITGEIKRCKDCGNPIGDQNICPLCGARN